MPGLNSKSLILLILHFIYRCFCFLTLKILPLSIFGLKVEVLHFNNLNFFFRVLRKSFGKKRFPSKQDLDQIIFDKNEKDRIIKSEILIKNMRS